MKHWSIVTLTGLILAAMVASPILAQRGQGRSANDGQQLSRECRQEVVKLCAKGGQRDRSKVRVCLQEKASELSEDCQTELRERMGNRNGAQRGNARASGPVTAVDTTLFYGSHQRQQIDIYKPKAAIDDLPLIVFIHGGGWAFGSHKAVQEKPGHFTRANMIFASTGYRVLPDAPVEEQAGDLGMALQLLRSQAQSLGFDPDQIILMGHSAGAHLAALVATDPQYAGDAFASIKGVVLLDGAGYDVPENMRDAGFQALRLYETAFGFDEARQKALSPVTHVGGPDAPHWLALYVEERAEAKKQANLLVNGLTTAGASAKAVAITGTDHGRMNREIGTEPGKAQTETIDAFLTEVLK